MRIVAERAGSMRAHCEALQNEHLQKMLQVYQHQMQKSNLAKVNERLKYLHVLR